MAQCCSFRGVFWGLAAFGVVADQLSKYHVFRWLYNDGTGDRHEVIPGVFRLDATFTGKLETQTGFLASLRTWGGDMLPHVNQGALFGFGHDHKEVANYCFAAISIVAAVAIIYWGTRRATRRDSILTIALSLILAGTLGNLYDRIVFHGVRDFLHFYWFEWPVFNIADCCLVTGAFLLLVQAFWIRPPVEQPALTETVRRSEPASV